MIAREEGPGRLTLRLDRPERANALTRSMLGMLSDALAEAATRDDLRLLVLTGSGKVFSAGADLDEVRNGLSGDPVWEEVSTRLAALPCLTVAALNGTLAGGAFGLALACDLRLAVPGASFFYPVLRNGFLPQPSDVRRLAALIGPAGARRILLAGERLDAAEALRLGLVDHLAEAEELPALVDRLAADALADGGTGLAAIKAMIDAGTAPEGRRE